jgi:hypothetical protein
LTQRECERELARGRECLEDLLHERVCHLAYPRGLHNGIVRVAAERVGFTRCYSLPVRLEPVGRLSLPRVGVYSSDGLSALRIKTLSPYLAVRLNRVISGAVRRSRAKMGLGYR